MAGALLAWFPARVSAAAIVVLVPNLVGSRLFLRLPTRFCSGVPTVGVVTPLLLLFPLAFSIFFLLLFLFFLFFLGWLSHSRFPTTILSGYNCGNRRQIRTVASGISVTLAGDASIPRAIFFVRYSLFSFVFEYIYLFIHAWFLVCTFLLTGLG